MVSDLEKFEGIQEKIARQVNSSNTLSFDSIKKIAGFDCAFFDDQILCGAVVIDAKTCKVIEKKYIIAKSPMRHIHGFTAFREGPAIIQAYYSLESEPDVLMIDGHGIAHEKKCGLATYVGIELNKPAIGVAKSLLVGEIKDDKIMINNEVRGALLKTKAQANPLFVSPGHFIDINSCIEIAGKLVITPHKLPEPLHEAHKFAKKTAIKINCGEELPSEETCKESEQERLEKEFGVNSGNIV